MKITIESLAEFIGEIERDHANIHDGTIRLRSISTEVNEVCREISYVVTAVVSDDDGNGYLLRYAEDCGVDADSRKDGTDKAAAANDLLAEKCDQLELHIRPGEIEL